MSDYIVKVLLLDEGKPYSNIVKSSNGEYYFIIYNENNIDTFQSNNYNDIQICINDAMKYLNKICK